MCGALISKRFHEKCVGCCRLATRLHFVSDMIDLLQGAALRSSSSSNAVVMMCFCTDRILEGRFSREKFSDARPLCGPPIVGGFGHPGEGVFRRRVLDGAANLGIRPSFDPPKELLEPYFFNFDGDLYGQTIAVEFHAFIRGEEKFADMAALKDQMAQDCEMARELLV